MTPSGDYAVKCAPTINGEKISFEMESDEEAWVHDECSAQTSQSMFLDWPLTDLVRDSLTDDFPQMPTALDVKCGEMVACPLGSHFYHVAVSCHGEIVPNWYIIAEDDNLVYLQNYIEDY